MMHLPGLIYRPREDHRADSACSAGRARFNVNSWSPDSKKFAFVSYELLKK